MILEILKSIREIVYMKKSFPQNHADGQKSVFDLPIDEFNFRLTQYLFSPSGSKYRLMFKYDSPISCGKPAPKILVCKSYLPRLKVREFQNVLLVSSLQPNTNNFS